jgi:hypothetical protein
LIDEYKKMPEEYREKLDLQHPKLVERILTGQYKRSQVDNKIRNDRN